jgi:hypothetical protein
VSVDGVKLQDDEFSYDESTNKVTISITGTDIYIGAYNIGQFNVDLNVREIAILADAMSVFFVASNVNTSRQLEQLMYSGVDMFSQSQHTKVSLALEEFRRSTAFKNMIYYSYGRDNDNSWSIAKKAGGLIEQ